MASMRRLAEYVRCAGMLGRTPAERWRIFWRLTKNVRVRVGLGGYHPDAVYELQTRLGPVFLRDNFGDVTNLPGLFCDDVYQVDRLAADGVVLDVGANIGLFAARIAFHNPGRRILCFEPLEGNTRMIRLNCPTAEVFRIAVGRTRSHAKLGVDRHGIMASAVDTRWPTDEVEFDVLPLDQVVSENGITAVAFLKIDCEGMELDVLDGAHNTLRQAANVALETHGHDRHREVIARLEAAGLTIREETFADRTGTVFAFRAQPTPVVARA